MYYTPFTGSMSPVTKASANQRHGVEHLHALGAIDELVALQMAEFPFDPMPSNSQALANLPNILIQHSGIEKTFLLDVVSKIYVATDSAPVDINSNDSRLILNHRINIKETTKQITIQNNQHSWFDDSCSRLAKIMHHTSDVHFVGNRFWIGLLLKSNNPRHRFIGLDLLLNRNQPSLINMLYFYEVYFYEVKDH